jgi:hypothetical protein
MAAAAILVASSRFNNGQQHAVPTLYLLASHNVQLKYIVAASSRGHGSGESATTLCCMHPHEILYADQPPSPLFRLISGFV